MDSVWNNRNTMKFVADKKSAPPGAYDSIVYITVVRKINLLHVMHGQRYAVSEFYSTHMSLVPPHHASLEATGFSPVQKQNIRSAVLCAHCKADQGLCLRYTDSIIYLLD